MELIEQGFVTWKVRSSPTLADYLREGRERRHLQLKPIAEKINIRQVHLELLELGDFDKLPGDVYVRGFIRKYATFLKLDAEYAVKLYKREIDIKRNVVKSAVPSQTYGIKHIRNPLLLMTPRSLVISIVGICLMVSSLYMWNQFSNLASAPQLKVFEPGDKAVMKSSSLVVNGKTDTGSSVLINGQLIFVDTNGNFNESVRLQDGVNAITIVARNKLGKETSVTKEVLASVVEQPLALNTITAEQIASGVGTATGTAGLGNVAQEGVELDVNVDKKATWLYVEVDGAFEFSGTMLPGSGQTFKGSKNVSVTTADASTTRVVFNGVTIGNLSDQSGPLRDLEFTQDMQIKQGGKLVRKL